LRVGRNGGFVTSYWVQYLALLKLAGPEGAAWIASRTADAVREQVGVFPVDPFPYLGAIAMRETLRRKKRLKDTGRRPGWVTPTLAGLAPSGYVPKEAT
jgi:hypothetical protein